jgi:hypothetical protein
MLGPHRVITIGSSFQRAYQCKVESCELASAVITSEELAVISDETAEEAPDSKRNSGSFEPAVGVKEILIDPDNSGDKRVRIGIALSPKKESTLVDFLHSNKDIFAWKPSDMLGIPREVAEHALKIRLGSKPVKQCLCHFDEEKRRAIGEEIARLLAARFIREVYHPEWLANPVLVQKKSGKWRMCVNYMSLNKACPKDPFPLRRIDQVVDSTSGCKTLCFLNAYSRYHQIATKESDQLATSFITPFGLYYYVTVPFGLKNAGQHISAVCSGVLATSSGEPSVTVHVFVMLDIYFVGVKYMFIKCKACVCLCETFENLKVQVKRVFL